MPSRFAQFGGAAGADAALREMIAERLMAEEAQRKQAIELHKLGQADRGLDLEGGRLGLDRDKFGQQQTEYTEGAPMRTASLEDVKSQTGYRLGAPMREADARAQQGMMAENKRLADEAAAKTQHGYRLGEITAQGNQQARVAGIRTAGAAGGSNVTGPYSQERALRTRQSVKELMGKVNRRTTGMGSLLSGIPESGARNFKAELDTLKANIAFNELTQMRAASKTGGALGQVSERELALLTATLGALDAGQSPENLRQQLQKVDDSIARWETAQSGQAVQGAAVEFDFVDGKLVQRR